MKNFKYLIFILGLYCSVSNAWAVGADGVLVVKAMAVEQKVNHAVDLKFLTQLKIISDGVIDSSDKLKEMVDVYTYVVDFSVEAKIKRLNRAISNLDQFSDFGTLDNNGKYKRVRQIIKRRFKRNPEKAKIVTAKLEVSEGIRERIKEKIKTRDKNRQKTNTQPIQQDIADSLSILAVAKLKEEEAMLNENIRQDIQSKNQTDEAIEHFKRMKK